MPAKKKDRVSFYPSQWFSLIASVSDGRVVVVNVKDRMRSGELVTAKSAAHSLRWRFYDLRKLLREDPERQKDSALADGIVVTVQELSAGKATLTFTPRDITQEAIDIELALADQLSTGIEEPAAEDPEAIEIRDLLKGN